MNSRSSFRRAQQWQLAERQRYVTELEALGERLRADIERLRGEISEAAGSDEPPAHRSLDPLFVRPLVERREKLLRSVAEVDAQLVEARAAAAGAQQEMRLVEGTVASHGLTFEDRLTRRARRSI